MDEFSAGYQPESYTVEPVEGDYKIKIMSIQKKVSSTGNNMLEMEIAVQGFPFNLKYYLVKNDHFNANATRFFDAFGIPQGNFEYVKWISRVATAHIAKGKPNASGKSFWEVKYLHTKPKTDTAKEPTKEAPQSALFNTPAPPLYPMPAQSIKREAQVMASGRGDEFTDTIPF